MLYLQLARLFVYINLLIKAVRTKLVVEIVVLLVIDVFMCA